MNLTDNSKFVPLKSKDSFTMADEFEFNIEHKRSDMFNSLDDEIIDLTEQVRIMDCQCPHCSERVEVDLAAMPESGFEISCSFCNTRMQIQRESCVCRARRRSHEINCVNCGNSLDHHAHCHSCGVISPDYFVTVNPHDARRKARKKYFHDKLDALKALNLSLTPALKGNDHASASEQYHPKRIESATAASSMLWLKKTALIVTCLIISVGLISAGVFAYNSYKSEQAFAQNYCQTLYCIKIGVDTNVKAWTLLKSEWEAASASGKPFSPVIGNKDVIKLNKLRSEIDTFMQKVSKPPKRFLKSSGSLIVLHKVYLNSEALMQAKPGSPQELGNSLETINKNMIAASQELKSSLTGSLKNELENAKLKYRGLKDF